MKLPENLLDCSELQIARDIPKELALYQNVCNRLTQQNRWYKNALIITSSGMCLYLIYKIMNHYATQKNQKRTQKKQQYSNH